MQRSNSWTSSRGLDASDIDTKDLLDDNDKPSSGMSGRMGSSRRRSSDMTPEEDIQAIINSPQKPKVPSKTPKLPSRMGLWTV
jgi:hypothetical protein